MRHTTLLLVGTVIAWSIVACSSTPSGGDGAPPAESHLAVLPSGAAPSSPPGQATQSPVASTAAAPAQPTAPSEPATCASLAHAGPAGTLTVEALGGAKPVDVYAVERAVELAPATQVRELAIVLTGTARECTYEANSLSPLDVNELSVVVGLAGVTLPPEIGVGTYSADTPTGILRLEHVAGEACVPPPPPDASSFSFGGTADSVAGTTGTVTIAERTSTNVKGAIDVLDEFGSPIKLAFDAPICRRAAKPPNAPPVTCCPRP